VEDFKTNRALRVLATFAVAPVVSATFILVVPSPCRLLLALPASGLFAARIATLRTAVMALTLVASESQLHGLQVGVRIRALIFFWRLRPRSGLLPGRLRFAVFHFACLARCAAFKLVLAA